MSCAEVMYQPYAPYFPYQRSTMTSAAATGVSGTTGLGPIPLTATPPQTATDFRKFGTLKINDNSEHTGSEFPVLRSVAPLCHKDKGDAQYLSANCVLFTYYTGDISSVVDEHFSRALSQSSPFTPDNPKGQTKDFPPMSHRNFPPSFWNSNYQPAPSGHGTGLGAMAAAAAAASGHADLSPYSNDPYHTGLHASLHHQSDPWHYNLSGQAAGHFGHHRSSVHELSYPGMSTVTVAGSRFSPQYSSLLLQPSAVRSARISAAAAAAAAACAGLDKSTESWGTARYHEPVSHNTLGHMDSNYGSHYGGMPATITGLDSQVQDSKDLYWF